MGINNWPEGERPRDNTPRSGLLRRRQDATEWLIAVKANLQVMLEPLTLGLCRNQKLRGIPLERCKREYR